MGAYAPGAPFEERFYGFRTGLVGTAGWRLLDNQGATTIARATTGIAEHPASSGSYVVIGTCPTTAGRYSVFFDSGVVSPSTTASEDLEVTGSLISAAVLTGTFTYDPTLDTTLDQVRFLIGDVDSSAPLFVDAEISFYLTASAGVVNTAAANLAEALSIRFARAYDFSADGQSFKRSQMSERYATLAKELRIRAGSIAVLIPTRVDGYSDDIAADEVGSTSSSPRIRYGGGSDFDVP